MDAGRQGMAGNGHCLPLRKGVEDEYSGHAFLVEGMPFFLGSGEFFGKVMFIKPERRLEKMSGWEQNKVEIQTDPCFTESKEQGLGAIIIYLTQPSRLYGFKDRSWNKQGLERVKKGGFS